MRHIDYYRYTLLFCTDIHEKQHNNCLIEQVDIPRQLTLLTAQEVIFDELLCGPQAGLRSTTQHYTALRITTQHYTVLHSTTQYYAALHSTTQYYTVLHSTTQYYTVLHSTTQHYTVLHSTTQHYTELRITTQHYASLHITTQHYTAPEGVLRFAKRFAVFKLQFSSEVLKCLTSVLSCHAVMTDSTTVRPPNGGILSIAVQCCRCYGNGSCQNCLCRRIVCAQAAHQETNPNVETGRLPYQLEKSYRFKFQPPWPRPPCLTWLPSLALYRLPTKWGPQRSFIPWGTLCPTLGRALTSLLTSAYLRQWALYRVWA